MGLRAEMPLAEDQDVIQALAAERSHEPLGKCIRTDDRTGILMTRVPLPAKTPSNAVVNLLSRSRIKNLNPFARSPRSMSKLRACWTVQAPDAR
jgi:hypothetical protein